MAQLAGLSLDTSSRLTVRLADGEQRICCGVARGVRVQFSPGVVQIWDFWVVPLTMDLILGLPWLQKVQPIIDWDIQRVLWEHAGDLVEVYGRGASAKNVPRSTTQPQMCIVSSKRFLRDMQRGEYEGESAGVWVCLLQPRAVCATCSAVCCTCNVQAAVDAGPVQMCAGSTADTVQLNKLLHDFADVFEPPGIPPAARVKHRIELRDESKAPPKHRTYRMSQLELDELKRQLDEMLAKGWIAPSCSPYGHPVLFARKKCGALRLCVDYRSLNANTRIDRYPIPRIDELLDRLSNCSVFSSLDLQTGYHQVEIEPSHQYMTAFSCKWGLFEFKVMPFGLTNAPSTFQRFMNEQLSGFEEFCGVYLDDILVYSTSVAQHLEHLRAVLQRMRDKQLSVKRKKCEFLKNSLKFLGHVISSSGVAPDPDKVAAIRDMPVPSDVPRLRSFLGCANFYERFVRHYATICAPLTDLLGSGVSWSWGPNQQAAFDTLKQALCSAPVLLIPDLHDDFVVETDASSIAVGGSLSQDQGQGLQPVAYFSKKLTGAPRNYATHERELLAIVIAIKKWRPYLDGKCTRVITDHAPLTALHSQPHLSSRQIRWLEFLGAYHLQFEYRPGAKAAVPDFLSRIHSIVVEPSWLARVARAQHAAPELVGLLERARGRDSTFRFRGGGQHPVLYRLHRGREQLVLPRGGGFHQLVLQELHDGAIGGHLGAAKTFEALQTRVWWPKMRTDVETYVAACPVCQRVKDRTMAKPGLLQPLPPPTERFACYTMDFIFGLPACKGSNGIMTVVDRATKRVTLIPVQESVTAVQVADLFLHWIVRCYGMPREIIADRDPRFMSAFWQQLFSRLGTSLLHSTAHHPQTDGQTERAHRVIEQILRAYVLGCPVEKWVDQLVFVEMCLNAHISSSTGQSPNELTFGQQLREPLDLAGGMTSEAPAATAVARLVQERLALARQCMARAQAWQKAQYDRHHRAVEFSIGQLVLLTTTHLPLPAGRKLGQRWVGPFRVAARVGPVAYKLELPESMQIHPVFHVSMLRPYDDTGSLRQQPPPTPIEVGGQQEFEVARILRHRRRGRGLQYLVAWVGYDLADATWEPESHLTHAAERVTEYWASQGSCTYAWASSPSSVSDLQSDVGDDQASESSEQALAGARAVGIEPRPMCCPYCSGAHVDRGWHARHVHRVHLCHHCGLQFVLEPPGVGHPRGSG